MKNKYEVFSKFKEFKALIEYHTENKINTFRSDDGGKFTSNEFKELYPSGKKGIFVGYSKSSKAYRIYFPGYKKIDISRM